ncbi:MAG: hypothetical protein ABI240_05260, partial [Sphingomonas sp.]
ENVKQAVAEPAPGSPPAERNIPADLDTPLAAFDPDAIPAASGNWPPKGAPLPRLNLDSISAAPFSRFTKIQSPRQQMFDPGERFETFELTPPVPGKTLASEPVSPARPRDSARVEMDPSASIHALLDRLERSVARREIIAPPAAAARVDSLQETLGTLRRLAAGR